jgi:hypothetical protein
MPRIRRDLTGLVVGRLTALRCVGRDKRRTAIWRCRCSCDGKEVEVRGTDLTRQHPTRSCGCAQRDWTSTRNRSLVGEKSPTFKHGHTRLGWSPTYSSWHAMLGRCTNPKGRDFRSYGGAGVKVCDRWLKSFEAFLEDMGPRPDSCTLGRYGDVGNYEPRNCAWQTRKEQGAEKRIKNQLRFLAAA